MADIPPPLLGRPWAAARRAAERTLATSSDGQRGRSIEDAGQLRDPEPDLTDGVVTLRPWRFDDVRLVEQASADPRIPHGTTVPVPYTPEAAREFILRQHRRTQHWQGWSLVIEGPDATATGATALMLHPQPGVAGIGYWLLAPARGRGFATRAVRLLTDWALGPAALERVEAWVEPHNDDSVAVLTRAGFRREGLLRSFLVLDGERADVEVLSRLPDDPAPDLRP